MGTFLASFLPYYFGEVATKLLFFGQSKSLISLDFAENHVKETILIVLEISRALQR